VFSSSNNKSSDQLIQANQYVQERQLATQAYLPTLMGALNKTFHESNLSIISQDGSQSERNQGKVRERYNNGKHVVLVTSDRLTAFDRAVRDVPCKGAVLNLVSKFWFEKTKHIMRNHFVSAPHSNVTIGLAVEPIAIEFVVRGYITGTSGTSMLTHYLAGEREYCGIKLPDGLKPHQKLDSVMITPTTKSDAHDELISPQQIIEQGLMTQAEWEHCAAKAIELFNFASAEAAKRGLILVDTKMEMGRTATGEIILIDELFTPDSSRYWLADGYDVAFNKGESPPNIDKEYVRKWINKQCDPYDVAELPEVPGEVVTELSRRYILLYELITGLQFPLQEVLETKDVNTAVQEVLDRQAVIDAKNAARMLGAFKLNESRQKEQAAVALQREAAVVRRAAEEELRAQQDIVPIDKNDPRSKYENPLISRYASFEMSNIWSDNYKFVAWRRAWIALAEAEMELGLPVSEIQVTELKEHLTEIDFKMAAAKEKELRHDVMAHIQTYAAKCPNAKPIIHLGATSCFVTCNTEIIQLKESMRIVRSSLLLLLRDIRNFALAQKSLPTLGYTHFQPAQLVTVGKRASLWAEDLLLDLEQLNFVMDILKLRGAKGTTGTQATYLQLFKGDHAKVKALDDLVCKKLGFASHYPVTGQTAPRKIEHYILGVLSGIAQSVIKMCTDIRHLANLKEIEEPFESTQVGSSAMAYKRNPMRSERACSLARHVMALAAEPGYTAALQWMERTLDDSANRRIVLPEAFLGADAIIGITRNVMSGLIVWPKVIEAHVKAELPFMATENILMACVEAGGDRQDLHEAIREHSMAAGYRVKSEGAPNDLIDRIRADQRFAAVHQSLDTILDPIKFIGRCPEQVDDFCNEYLDPVLNEAKLLDASANQAKFELRV
jgi:adenylosuccinate lyase